MATEQDAGILAPGSSLGRYTIVRRLAGGSMGQVYEARHTDLDKRVAVKVMGRALGASADLRERFLREGKAAARVRHPHAVDISDVGVDNNRLYLVMEYLEGEDLAALLAREKKLTPERTADLMLPVVAALAAVHEEGIVHRDLKPANIFVSRTRQGTIHPKVLDFGVSKMTQSSGMALTANADVLGTPVYMAPEQARASYAVDARADVYSVGGILYECVVGQRAFSGGVGLIFQQIATGTFPRPRSVAPELPEGFEALVLRAMAVRPEDRFATMNDLGCALLPFASPAARVLWSPVFGQAVPGAAVRDALDSLPPVPTPPPPPPRPTPEPALMQNPPPPPSPPPGDPSFGAPLPPASGVQPVIGGAPQRPQFSAMSGPAAEAALRTASGRPPGRRRAFWIAFGAASAFAVVASAAMIYASRQPSASVGPQRITLRRPAPSRVAAVTPDAGAPAAVVATADASTTAAITDASAAPVASPVADGGAPVVATEPEPDSSGHHHHHGHHHDDGSDETTGSHHHRHHHE